MPNIYPLGSRTRPGENCWWLTQLCLALSPLPVWQAGDIVLDSQVWGFSVVPVGLDRPWRERPPCPAFQPSLPSSTQTESVARRGVSSSLCSPHTHCRCDRRERPTGSHWEAWGTEMCKAQLTSMLLRERALSPGLSVASRELAGLCVDHTASFLGAPGQPPAACALGQREALSLGQHQAALWLTVP